MRLEVLGGIERRRRWSRDEKMRILAESLQPGAKVAEVRAAQALCRAGDGSAPFTAAWCLQHLPLIDAAVILLEADDAKFARQGQLNADEKGQAMLDEPADLLLAWLRPREGGV